jgi:hypothetical protein
VKKTKSEAIWQRFRGACDQFFARYAQRHDTARAERVSAREAICAEMEALAPSPLDAKAASAPQPPSQTDSGTASASAGGASPEGAAAHLASEAESPVDVPAGEPVAVEQATVSREAEPAVSPEPTEPPADLATTVRTLRARWQQEIAARGVDAERARALDTRFAAALNRVLLRWPAAFAGTDLDPAANRKRMETLVKRLEDLAVAIAGPPAASDASLSPTNRLAAMLKEALAANTIGGKVEDDSRLRAAAEEVRQAQAAWTRIGLVPDDVRRSFADRFHRAARRINDKVTAAGAAKPAVVATGGGPKRGPGPGRGPR